MYVCMCIYIHTYICIHIYVSGYGFLFPEFQGSPGSPAAGACQRPQEARGAELIACSTTTMIETARRRQHDDNENDDDEDHDNGDSYCERPP